MSDFGRNTASLYDANQRIAYLEKNLPPEIIDLPYVSGVKHAGSTLSCTTGNWHCSPTSYAYAWHNSVGVIGTNSPNYLVVAGNVGQSIYCVVTAINANGSVAAPRSNSVVIT